MTTMMRLMHGIDTIKISEALPYMFITENGLTEAYFELYVRDNKPHVLMSCPYNLEMLEAPLCFEVIIGTTK